MINKIKAIVKGIIKEIVDAYEKTITSILAPYRRVFLTNRDFTIISNNCLGGFIYQRYNLPYLSPTVGLYFMADDYIKFVSDLRIYLNMPLSFIAPEESRYVDDLKLKETWKKYPVGLLGDIEIHFLHYKSQEEALEKWNRRVRRVNWDNMLIKFCEQNNCEYRHLKAFDELKHPYKFCFATKKNSELKSITLLKADEGRPYIRWRNEKKYYNKYFHITKLLNLMKKEVEMKTVTRE